MDTSPKRGLIAVVAVVWVVAYIVLLAAVPERVAHFLASQQVAALLGILILTALFGSIAAVEFARRYVLPNRPWTGQMHLAAIVLAWLPFAILSTGYWWLRCGDIK